MIPRARSDGPAAYCPAARWNSTNRLLMHHVVSNDTSLAYGFCHPRDDLVGPREDGDPVGGKVKLEGSIELSYPLVEVIKAYTFFDFGQVWEEMADVGEGKINTSIGVGIGLRTPVGPIRVDFGYPLNPDDDQGNGEFHFTTGISF